MFIFIYFYIYKGPFYIALSECYIHKPTWSVAENFQSLPLYVSISHKVFIAASISMLFFKAFSEIGLEEILELNQTEETQSNV